MVGATVTVAGGPRSVPTQTATTNASGIATFPGLPAGSGYTVTAAKGGQSAPNQSASVSGGSTTNLTFVFPTGSLKAVVTWAGVNGRRRTVTLTGGPGGDLAHGNVGRQRRGAVLERPGRLGLHDERRQERPDRHGEPDRRRRHHDNGSRCDADALARCDGHLGRRQRLGRAASHSRAGRCRSRPLSATTAGSGQVTFSNVPAGAGYTLAATKNGQTTTLTSQTFTTVADDERRRRPADGDDRRQRRDLGRPACR